MSNLTPEQEEEILNKAPWGTFSLLILYAVFFMAGWLFLYLVTFLSHGPVN